MSTAIFTEREDQIHRKGEQPFRISCDKESLAGAVSQRACVFCGSRVVLYPIADALHWFTVPSVALLIPGTSEALSLRVRPAPTHFSTDLQEQDVIFGGEDKLYRALTELIDRHSPKAAFVNPHALSG